MKIEQIVTTADGACQLSSFAFYRTRKWKDEIPPFAACGAHPGDVEADLLQLYPDVTYQTFCGFGGAFTQSAALAMAKLPQVEQEKLLDGYFAKEGIGYTVGRLPMGSCDFSVSAYSYVQEGDRTLESFDVSADDATVFDMVRRAQEREPQLALFASPWTPPPYMKTVTEWQGGSLNPAYADLWARYYGKYVAACKKRGIRIQAFTVQNEPRHHQMWESCNYTKEQEIAFVNEYLAPVLKPLGVKIYAYDHCKERVFDRAKYAYANSDAVDGIAFHWYSGDCFEELRMTYEKFPNKELIMSEGCVPLSTLPPSLQTQWEAAERYTRDIIGNLNAGLTSFCDWNLTLDENRGPSHFREGRYCVADAPVISDGAMGKVVFQPSYYAIGQFSKYVRPGAKRIGFSKPWRDVEATAFQNADGSIVAVVYNPGEEQSAKIRLQDELCDVKFPARSVSTFTLTQE